MEPAIALFHRILAGDPIFPCQSRAHSIDSIANPDYVARFAAAVVARCGKSTVTTIHPLGGRIEKR